MNKKYYFQKGQGLIEMILAIGLIGLVLTGLAALMIKSTGVQTKTSRRNQAVVLSKVVMEEIVAQSKNDPDVFWQEQNLTSRTKAGYDGFTYNVTFTPVTTGGTCTTSYRCVDVEVRVLWTEGTVQEVYFSRFFSR